MGKKEYSAGQTRQKPSDPRRDQELTLNLYALHDWDTELKTKFGAFPILEPDAAARNNEGYGIYFTPNDFAGARKKENITQINSWIADIDAGTKPEQMTRIDKLIMRPSMIIESKRGYHLYWQAADATLENYRIVQEGIIEKTGADAAVKDPARLMRTPGYWHKKDKDNPFLIKTIFRSDDKYTEKEMLYAFERKKLVHKTNYNFDRNADKSKMLDPANWNRIFFLDKLTNGNRNNEFCRIVLWLRDSGFPAETIRETIFEMNRRITNPLEENEIESLLKGKI